MDNNNMDNFFRQHSQTMDEAPGDALWQRIEGKLPPVNTSISSGKVSIWGSKFLLVLMLTATVIVAGIVFIRNNNKEVLKPTVTIPTNTVMSETAIEQDTVKKKKQVSKVATETQSIPFRPTKKPINKQQEITDLSTSAPEKTTVTTQPLPEPKVIKTTVVYNPKRTIVTVTEKVDQGVFDSITKANIEKYKSHAGMQLIVKESRSGHVFRTKFENAFKPGRLTFEQKKDSLATNGMKLMIPKTKNNITPINVNFDTIKKSNNMLLPEPIRFKTDSIPY
nr:hypothetical protein [uncultured Flavobacterium sp.]